MATTSKSNNIDTSKFKFVGVDGQYFLAIAVKTEVDGEVINFFNQEADLISYLDVSRVGFELPAVEIVFSFSDEKLHSYLNERNVFILSIGQTKEDQIQSEFRIITADLNQKVAGKWMARIVGVYNRLYYLKGQEKRSWVGTSVDVAKKVLENNLGVPSIEMMTPDIRSRDSMIWFQANMTPYQFLYKLWLHSNIPNSVWMTAIDFTGKVFMTDLRKQAKEVPFYTLTTGNPDNDYTFSVLDVFDVSDNSGVYNSFGGYHTYKQTYDLDQSRVRTDKKVESVVLSNSDSFNKISSLQVEGKYNMKTGNVHSGFYASPMHNKSLLLALKSFQLCVSSEGKFLPVRLLEYVMFKDVQPNGQAQGSYSGPYMVGKIAHQIVNKKLYTHIDLWRESTNSLRNTMDMRSDVLNNKLNTITSNADNSKGLMTAEEYNKSLSECDKLKEKADKLKNQGFTSKAYNEYKKLDKEYKKVKSYISNVYSVSSILTTIIPEADIIEDELLKITEHTEIEKIQSTMRKYLNLQTQMDKVTLQSQENMNSNSVYENVNTARSKANRIKSLVEQLRAAGLVKDPNEYAEPDQQ